MARVGVVVVTYRSAATIESCLASLRATSEGMEVVVVDNASDDDSAALAAAGGARIIARSANAGYAAANNEGVAALAADTEYVVFANPDTVWPSGALDELVALLADPSIGLASPLLVDDAATAQPIVEDDPTLSRTVLGMTRLRPPVRPRVPSRDGTIIDVDWVHTAAAAMPLQLFREIGGFDERFFLFAEDADLCRRVRATGKRVVIDPRVTVQHVGGASVDASHDDDGAAALRTRALAQYIEKYQGPLARRVFGAVGTAVYGVGRHRGQAREAWRALTR